MIPSLSPPRQDAAPFMCHPVNARSYQLVVCEPYLDNPHQRDANGRTVYYAVRPCPGSRPTIYGKDLIAAARRMNTEARAAFKARVQQKQGMLQMPNLYRVIRV